MNTSDNTLRVATIDWLNGTFEIKEVQEDEVKLKLFNTRTSSVSEYVGGKLINTQTDSESVNQKD